MLQNDASQTGSTPEARNDLDILNQCDLGPATGNTISGAGTVTGSAGADTAAAGAMIVAVNGVESVGGIVTVEGQYGTLTIQSDGSYTYTRSANAPDGVNDVFTYTLADGAGARDTATLTIELRCAEEPDEAQTLVNTTDGVVMLPAGVELSDIRVVGRDLVITLPDGSTITVPNGAVFVPQIVIGDVEVPPSNLAALLIESEPQPAAGTPESSGGNFAVDVPPLDPGVPLGDLLPPTDFGFTPPVFEEVGQFLDEEPEVEIQPDGQPASANAVDTVDEAGLPPRGSEPPGSNQGSSSETTSGVILIDSPDEPSVVTINGVAVTEVGQEIEGEFGILTITSIGDGEIGYSYTLADNTSGNNTHDDFTVVVTDSDGDTDTATLTINIIDDVPNAVNDSDSIAAGEFGPATGNVLTDADAGDAGDGDNGADTVGADDADLTDVSGAGDTVANADGSFTVEGEYGVLTIAADGSYSYVRNAGTPGGVTDTFTYTLTDGDGDTDTATLTIDIGDLAPEAGDNPLVQLDDDALPGGNPGGTGDDADSVNTTGTLSGSGGDGELTFELQTSGAPDGFTYVDGPDGSVLVQQNGVTVLTITVDAETGEYSVTQNAAIEHPAGGNENDVVFDIAYTVTDADGDAATGSLTINVDDDTPVVSQNTLGGTVDEDGLEAGIPGGTGDVAGANTVATGNVSTLFSAGADTPLTFALLADTSGLPALTSNGAAVTYAVDGNVLTALAGGEAVFTFTLNADGSYSFELLGQLDHAPGGAENDLTISLGSIIQATDADGDSVTAADGGLVITVDDDTPVATGEEIGATVDEDGVPGGIAGGTGDIAGETAVATGSVAALFASGADQPLTFTLLADTSGLPALTSNGVAVTYTVNGDTLTASAGGSDVFTFTLNADGSYTFTLLDQLDHAPGGNENDLAIALGSIIQATDADGDSVTAEGDGLIVTVDDDTPTVSGEQSTGTVDEDGVPAGIPGGSGDVAGEATVATGSVSAVFESGADQPLSFSLSTDTSGLPALTSNGVAVTYTVAGNVLTASAGGNTVFTLELNANGSWTFTLVDQLDHADGGAENDLLLELGSIIRATDADGDTVTADADGLVITVDDDTPTASNAQVGGTVDEDGVPGGIAGGTGDVAGAVTSVNGSVSTLFNSGADAPLDFALLADTSGLPALTSNGVAVTYIVSGDTLTASAGGTDVFTFTLNADGTYTFELLDQLDHAPGGDENDLTIELGSIIQATDADGDSVTAAADGLVITVDDDTPTASTAAVSGTVDEDGLAGGNPGGTGDVAGEDVTATGSVTTLFNSGADAPLTFSLSGDTTGLPALSSNGVPVTYSVSGSTLTASAGGATVFTFTLNANGSYTFTLVDQLDHATGGDENDLTIALGSIIRATDADGDSVTAGSNGLVITVDDDTPVAANDTDSVGDPGTSISGNVITDAAPGDAGDSDNGADSVGADQPGRVTAVVSVNEPGNSDTDASANFEIEGEFGVLVLNADGSYTYTRDAGSPGGAVDVFRYTLTDADGDSTTATLTITAGDTKPVAGTVSVQLDDDALPGGNPGGVGDDPNSVNATGTLPGSGGDGNLTFDLQTTGAPSGFTYVDGPNGSVLVQQNGTTVLTITIDADTGAYTVTQNAPIDHPAGSNENNVAFAISYTVTDEDTDVATGTINIDVDDDTPVATATLLTGSVDEDGVPGGIAGGTGDVAGEDTTATGSVATLFSAGADTPLTFSLLTATGGLPSLTSNGVPVTYAVVGDTLTASAGGNPVFTFELNADGTYTFTLIDQLDHAAGGNENDLTIALGSIIQATDADGDPVTASANGLVITVDDDTPTASTTVHLTGTVDEDGVPSGIAGGLGDVPGEVTVASGSVTTLFNSGADAPLSYSLSGTAGLPALTSAGVPVTYSVTLNAGVYTLTAMAGANTVFTFTLNATTGAYEFRLLDQLDHPALTGAAGDNTENDLLINLSSIIRATDADGDSVAAGSNGLVITVDDDMPVAFDPDPISTGLENEVGSTASGDLDVDGQIENNVGADQPGLIQFANVTQASGLTSGGEAIEYFVTNNGQTLEARTGGASGDLIFTIDLNQNPTGTDTYTVEMFGTIDNGSGVTFSDLSGGVAGNPPFKLITEPGSDLELLVTPINETSVNSDSDDIAAGSQFIEFGTGIRFDFGDFTYVNMGGTTNDDRFVIDEHANVNGYKFAIDQISNGTVVDIRVSAVDADDDGGAAQNNFGPDAGDVIDDITLVKVFDTSGALVGEFSGTDTTSFGFDVIFNADGTVSFENLPSDYSIQTYTADGYNRIEVFNEGTASPDGKFSVSQLSIESSNAGDPVDLNFDLQLTDRDGDTVIVDDALDITIAPAMANSVTTTSSTSSMSMEPIADKSSMLTMDSFEQQLKSVNAANSNTVFLGAIAAAGLGATPAAAHHAFAPQAEFAVRAETMLDSLDIGTGAMTIDTQPAASLLDKGSIVVQDVDAQSSGSSHHDVVQADHGVGGAESNAQAAPVELPGGTDAPAQAPAAEVAPAAMSVAMPSAEALAAADQPAVEGDKGSAEVARVLADALAGGGDGPNIDALIDAATGHGAGMDAGSVAASLADVPAWDMGAFHGFVGGHSALSMEAVMAHPDAAAATAA